MYILYCFLVTFDGIPRLVKIILYFFSCCTSVITLFPGILLPYIGEIFLAGSINFSW